MRATETNNVSCSKKLENEGCGCNNIDFSTLEILFKTASAFVDVTDFWTNGENCEEMTNQMMEEHAMPYETAVGK